MLANLHKKDYYLIKLISIFNKIETSKSSTRTLFKTNFWFKCVLHYSRIAVNYELLNSPTPPTHFFTKKTRLLKRKKFKKSYLNFRGFICNTVFTISTNYLGRCLNMLTPFKVNLVSNQFNNYNKMTKNTNKIIQVVLKQILFANEPILLTNNYTELLSRKRAWSKANLFLKKHRFIKKTRISMIFIQSALCILKFKDPKPLSLSIKWLLESVHYSKHRMYFYMIRALIYRFISPLKKKFFLAGVKLYLGGKLGVGGNAKKRRKRFFFGKCSNTTKTLRREDVKNYIWTRTGVLGFYISVFY